MVKKKKKSGKKSYAKKKKVSAGQIKKIKKTENSTQFKKKSETQLKNSKLKSNPNKKLIPYKSFGQKLFEILSSAEPQNNQTITLPEGNIEKKFFIKIFRAIKLFLIFIIIILSIEILINGKTSPFLTLANNYFIGFKTEQELSESLQKYLEEKINEEIFITLNNKTEKLSLKDLGYSYDLESTISSIPRFDIKRQNFFDILNNVAYPKFNSSFEQTKKIIEEKFNLNDKKPKNASISFKEKKLVIIPEQKGLELNWNEFKAELDNLAKKTKLTPLEFTLKTAYPTLTASDLEPKLESITSTLKKEIILNFNSKKFKITPIDFIDSINFESDTKDIKYSIFVENSPNYFAEKIYSKVEKPSSSIKITMDEKGNKTFEGNAQHGIEVDKFELNRLLSKALNEKNQKEIKLPINIKKAEVEVSENLKELGITSLIGVGHTAFAGSPPNRRINIRVGMEKYNGLIIKPNQEFSFNEHLGEVDAENGFVRELVIKAEGTVPEYGGGVCQVSSTAYKAALFSGLPIIERKPHSYAVSYYAQVDGHGLDSTIYTGVVDLKFLNDTPNHILIQSYIDGDEAYIKFYGTDDGRKVRLEGPFQSNYRPPGGTQLIQTTTLPTGVKKQVEKANAGFDILWNRYIQKPDESGQMGEEIKESIISKYRSTSNKILVGQ